MSGHSVTYRGHTIKPQLRVNGSPKPGLDQEWTEYQIREPSAGRKILHRASSWKEARNWIDVRTGAEFLQ